MILRKFDFEGKPQPILFLIHDFGEVVDRRLLGHLKEGQGLCLVKNIHDLPRDASRDGLASAAH